MSLKVLAGKRRRRSPGVSVPLRGNEFERVKLRSHFFNIMINEVSVPLRGNEFESFR
jgi:hypothetical protein